MSGPGKVNQGRSNPFKLGPELASLFQDAARRHQERESQRSSQGGEQLPEQPARETSSTPAQSVADAFFSSRGKIDLFDDIIAWQGTSINPLSVLGADDNIRVSSTISAGELAFLHSDARWTYVSRNGNSWVVLNFATFENNLVPMTMCCSGNAIRNQSVLCRKVTEYSNDVQRVFENILSILTTSNCSLDKSSVQSATRHLKIKHDRLDHTSKIQGDEHVDTFDAKVWTLAVQVFPLYSSVIIGTSIRVKVQETSANKGSLIPGLLFVDRTQAYGCQSPRNSADFRDILANRPSDMIRGLNGGNTQFVGWEYIHSVVTPVPQLSTVAKDLPRDDGQAFDGEGPSEPMNTSNAPGQIIGSEFKKHATVRMPVCHNRFGRTTFYL